MKNFSSQRCAVFQGAPASPVGIAEMTTKACAIGPSSVIVTSMRGS
jgi:hypothetical protein